MHAAAENLPELPGAGADVVFVDAVDRRLDDYRGCAMAGAGRAALDKAARVRLEAGHIERPVLHAHIDVVGPVGSVLTALGKGEDVTAVSPVVIDRLILGQKLDCSVDPVGHGLGSLLPSGHLE